MQLKSSQRSSLVLTSLLVATASLNGCAESKTASGTASNAPAADASTPSQTPPRTLSTPSASVSALASRTSTTGATAPASSALELDGPGVNSNITIGGTGPLQISTSSQYGGSIWSLTWGGYQYVNHYDHGRQIQLASFDNNVGGCSNPNEAGGGYDEFKTTSTSKVTAFQKLSANSFTDIVQPAYWYAPGTKNAACPAGMPYSTALSPDTWQKAVTIGVFGMQNVAEYDTAVTMRTGYTARDISAPIAFLNNQFTSALTFNPANYASSWLGAGGNIVNLPAPGFTETLLPIIAMTPDQQHAIAVYSAPSPYWTSYTVGRNNGATTGATGYTTTFTGVYYNLNATAPGVAYFRSYIIVGNLQQVAQSISAIAGYFANGGK